LAACTDCHDFLWSLSVIYSLSRCGVGIRLDRGVITEKNFDAGRVLREIPTEVGKSDEILPIFSKHGPEHSSNLAGSNAGSILLAWVHAMPFQVGLFFGKVAVLSFGGAYAALSYVSLHASGDWGWLSSGEMMDGLGLAETTPGPLLIALQFVAFLGCYKAPGILSPLLSATLGSLSAVWSLFLPSFLWIFSLAPHLDGIARNPRMAGGLAAIGAVVTSVMTCLALWFSEALFLPSGRPSALPLLLALIAFFLLHSKKVSIVPLILLCGMANVLIRVMVPTL